MILKSTDKKTLVKALDNNYASVILEDVPIYIMEDTGEELVTLADVIKADERRMAKKYDINIYNIFELALLFAPVYQKKNAIRQKFRFNKMLFYVWKDLQKEYGENTLIFDKMGVARAGPVPIHLKDDIKELQKKDLIDIYLVKDGKKIPGSRKEWEELKDKKIASIECALTKEGLKLARNIWVDLDPEMKEIILDVKKELFYLDTEVLKDKVHEEYPEYKKDYTKNDTESFEEFLI